MPWFELRPSKTPIKSIMKHFVTLFNSFQVLAVTKSSALGVAGIHDPTLLKSLIKSVIGVSDMTSTTSLFFLCSLFGCTTVIKFGSLNSIERLVGFELKPSDSITKP